MDIDTTVIAWPAPRLFGAPTECANCHKRIYHANRGPWFHSHSLAEECSIPA